MAHLPICKMCRAPPCFASINHRDPSLDIQVKRDKYHSAKSRHHETVETRTRWHGSLTSQHRTELAQNTAHSTLHFYLVQPSGCHTTADITTGRTLNQSIFKVLEKGGNMHNTPKNHKPGSFLCPWSHLPPDAEYLATIPLSKKHPGGFISFFDTSRFPSCLVLWSLLAGDRPLGWGEGVIIVVRTPLLTCWWAAAIRCWKQP